MRAIRFDRSRPRSENARVRPLCVFLAASMFSAGVASAQERPEVRLEPPPVEDAIPETPSEDESRNPSGVIESSEEASPDDTGDEAPIEETGDEVGDGDDEAHDDESDEVGDDESDAPARPAPRWTQ